MIAVRLVIDINILVSAALKPDGLQRPVLLLALTRPARLYVSDAILAEYFSEFWKTTKVITSRDCINIAAPHLL